MAYTYTKLIKDLEKEVAAANMEVHAVKWLFLNGPYYCGYSALNHAVDETIALKFKDQVHLYIEKKIPPQYILNKAFFYGYEFYVDEGCFIPRPETEQLVEETIYRIDDNFGTKPIDIADICCGSGIMGITLKKEVPNSNVFMCDISKDAVQIVQKNASSLKANVQVECGDFITPALESKKTFDVIVCNPPYIKSSEVLEEMVVDHEPNIALFGGVDGLDFYRIIFKQLDTLLKDNGFIGFEFGYDQKDLLTNLITEVLPTKKYEFLQDFNGKDRMLFIYK